ncbi:hypothetical protein SDC9_184622 [bioreactor metagenome]|uniref:Uncharacterized protein n=1 Tax=bioreactor metagenome TaxID=1076179 RepID=A0A645HEX5_9ZZZZ
MRRLGLKFASSCVSLLKSQLMQTLSPLIMAQSIPQVKPYV